jgi:RimJ/RimL family protein N-acetyltransferase
LLLRAPTEADIDVIAPAFTDPNVGGEAGLPPVGAEVLRTMLRDQLPVMRAQGLLAPYVIEDTGTGTILGGANLSRFDPLRDTVELGYWLFSDARGRGVATRVVRALVEHAFANGILRVETHVRIGNVSSERVVERVGFVREGVKRRLLRHGGRRVDATLFALVAE